MSATETAAALLAELRRDFDGAFARTRETAGATPLDLITLHVNGDAYALRLSEIGGLLVDRAIAPLPGPLPELLGLTSVRGTLLPVYSLHALLGYPSAGVRHRWIVVAQGQQLAALAFETFDRYVRIRADAIRGSDRAIAAEHVSGVAEADDTRYAVVDIRRIVAAIAHRCATATAAQGPDAHAWPQRASQEE